MLKRIGVGTRLSDAVIHEDKVYVAGLVSGKQTSSITEETNVVLQKIDDVLAEANSGRKHIVTARIYLRKISDLPEVEGAWRKWLPPGCAPALAWMQNELIGQHHNVEIQLTAVAA
jgi:enamine deaminase RidA (YjgF/YER057c/UK114 family)